jgi:serine phosphatase RsbU (regulator of sigma subunit)/ligand-binding sensor domain-containing protein
VNYRSLIVPPARKVQADTIQVTITPLNLKTLDRTEKIYDRSSGLPSNSVSPGAIAPAPDGSIWVGTDRGAARYDGLWTVLDTLSGLPGNQVQMLLPARDGTVWIATNGGLARYRDGQVQTVSRGSFHTVIEDRGGGLWLGDWSGQIAYLDTVWTFVSLTGSTGSSSGTRPLLVEQTGAVWLASQSWSGLSVTLMRYDPLSVEAYELSLPQNFYVPWGAPVGVLSADGGFWLELMERSMTRAIGRWDVGAARLRMYRLPGAWEGWASIVQDRTGLLWVFGGGAILQFDGRRWSEAKNVDVASSTAALDQEGNIWFGHGNRGVIRYGPQTWTTYTGEEQLQGKRITCITEDRSGNLWYGSEKGLSRQNVDKSWTTLAVTDTLVYDVLVDRQGQVWVATARGVHRYDGNRWTNYTVREGLADTVATALAEGVDGRIWVGGRKGLSWHNGQRWQTMPVSWWKTFPWFDPNVIERLSTDTKGRLWIATEGGLYVEEQGRIRDYFEVFYPDRAFDLDSLFALKRPEEIRRGLKATLKGEVEMGWFLVKVDPYLYLSGFPDSVWQRVNQAYLQLVQNDAEFRALVRRTREEGYVAERWRYAFDVNPEWLALALLGGNQITSICEDKEGALWVTTWRGLFTRRNGTWTFYDYEQSALPFNGRVTNMTTDRRGNLWLATDQGAVCYDGHHWITFDASDGLADNQVSDIYEDHEGNFWFATGKGVTRYRPDRRPPQTRVVRGPEKTVGYGTSSLTFEFEGGDWEWEQRGLTFSYALIAGKKTPQEQDWSAWTERTLVQVAPPGDGHFIFYVKTRDKALNVDPTPATYVFSIAPPIWKRIWFQIPVGVGLVLIVVSSSYAVRKRRHARQAEYQARQAERQLVVAMGKELQTAHDLQMGLLPEDPVIPGLDIAGRCRTANHVGGDYYTYRWIDAEHTHLAIIIADATGHDMGAAIPAVMFSGMLDYAVREQTPAAILHTLNTSLCARLPRRTFITCCIGVLDLPQRTLVWSKAGHPGIYHYRRGDDTVRELEMGSRPLGIRVDAHYEAMEVRLTVGDMLVWYTDGVVEACNDQEEAYGYERLVESVRRVGREEGSSQEGIERVMKEVQEFMGGQEQEDDMTLVIVRVT